MAHCIELTLFNICPSHTLRLYATIGRITIPMTDTPSISLLVPICNVERYLRECLDSAQGQTLTDIEIICINDGSTDSSLEIINEYASRDDRFIVIDKPNSGYGDSMNKGFSIAKGEYVGILESDDFFEPDALELMYKAAKSVDAQVVKADFFLFWSTPDVRNDRFMWVDSRIAGHINPQVEREVFYRKPSIWSAIYKREFLIENDVTFLPSPGASYQDAGFNFKVWSSCTNAVLIDKPILHYRQDNEKSSVNSPGKVFCVCDEYEEMNKYLDTHHLDRPYLRAILSRMKFDTYEWNFDRLVPELREEFVPRMIEDLKHDEELGRVDLSIFDPGKRINRALLLHDSKLYAIKRASDGVQSRSDRFKSLVKHGGVLAALKIALFRLTH